MAIKNNNPSHETHLYFVRIFIIIVAKNAIKTIAKIRPKIRRIRSSLAIAATARTLSMDIEISAIVMVISALNNFLLSLMEKS